MDRRTFIGAALAAPFVAKGALAQGAYPNRPVRLIIPFAAGGSTDVLGRLVAQVLSDATGGQFVPENLTGAGGTIGAAAAAKAAPDGYTLVAGTPGSMAINAHLMKSTPYDPIRDFQPITLVALQPMAVTVRKDSPFKTLKDLIDAAKAQPGKIVYGSAGVGSISHLSTELLNLMTGIKMTHVPYRGTTPAMTDLIGGQVQVVFDAYASLQGFVTSGEARVLAIGTKERVSSLKDLPTVAETVPGYESSSWWGLLTAAKTPRPIVDQINGILVKHFQSGAGRDRLIKMGLEPEGTGPDAFAKLIKDKFEEYGKVVKAANIQAQ